MAGSRRSRPVERGGRGNAEPRTEGRGATRCRTGRRADDAPPADMAGRPPVKRGGRGNAEPRTEGRGAARCRTGRRADVAPPADTAGRPPVERGGRGNAEPRTEGRGAARCRTGQRADVAPPADTATRLPVERGKATSTEGGEAVDSPREHDDVRAAVASALAQALPAGGRVGIALSGGRDSIVL